MQKQEEYHSPEGAVGKAMTLNSEKQTASSKQDKIIGTNCYNCKFISDREEAVNMEELNAEGGLDPKNQEEMHRARDADLITLPGGSKTDTSNKKFCYNEKIQMYVTARMCCAYWDNEAVKRPWKQ